METMFHVHNSNFVKIRAIYKCIVSPPIRSLSQHVIDAFMHISESTECPIFIYYLLSSCTHLLL